MTESDPEPTAFANLGVAPELVQTLVTLGDTDYARSPEVIVHEMVHQWYGDLVTPTDWRDVWMNEGMTMYLQFVFEAETGGTTLADTMRQVAPASTAWRA